MWKYNGAVACMCGGALVGGAAANWAGFEGPLGAIIGGAIGIWLSWPN